MRPLGSRAALALLTLVYVFNFVDRQLVAILGQPIKRELALSDARFGLLTGTAFALFYTVLGLPIARLAERRSRTAIIAISLALWSTATALCGLARTFPELLLARIGVGIGEAGCAPPSQALIADLVPPARRATALALLSLGIPIGMLLAGVGGGWIGQALGWRAAFVVLGLPGIALALLLRWLMPEPARIVAPRRNVPPLASVARALLAAPAFRHMAAGATLASFAGYGLTSFAVPLLVRDFDLSLARAGSGFGIVAGMAIGAGIAGGGWLSDRWGRSNPAAPALVSGLGAAAACLLFEIALAQGRAGSLAVLAFAPLVCAHLYFGPTYAVTAASADPAARATAVALLLLSMNAIGLGLGPLFVGTLSDHLLGGLRAALGIDVLVYLWAAGHFLWAGRGLRRDQPQSASR